MKALLSFAPLFAGIGRPMGVALGLSLVTLAAGIALLGISGWFLTAAALTTAGAAFNLFGPSAGVRGLSFLRILSRYGEKLTGHDATLKLLSGLRHWLYGRLFPRVPVRGIGRADLVSRLIADVDALDTVFLLALGPISTSVVAGLALTGGLIIFLPNATWSFALCYFAAVLGVPAALVIATRRTGAAVLDAQADLRRTVLDGLDGHQDLVVFDETGTLKARADTAAQRLADARRRLATLGAVASGATQLLASGAILGTLLAGVAALPAGGIEAPLLVGLLLAIVAGFEGAAMLVRSATRLAAAAAAAERLREIADQPPAVAEFSGNRQPESGGAVRFEHVTFGYDSNRPVLQDVSFSLQPGEHVAITGPSGSGKSTLAHLLFRLADPQAGTIRLGGVDLRDIAPDVLHRRAALMTQDAPVFLDTIRNNLLVGRPDATDTDLMAALTAVGLDTFVLQLPQGLDTIFGEAGRTLSAGQARRLCLARSLLSTAELLVFDEPTTGLDPEAEAAFLSDLPRLLAGRTVLVITHAPLPAGAFDRVLAVRAGRLTISARPGDLQAA